MAPLRERFEPTTLERELRLNERRRLDRGEIAARWIASLAGVWLFSQVPLLASLCAGADLPRDGFLLEGVAQVTSVVAGAFALVSFGMAAASAAVALWLRTSLSAGWVVAGVAPWLLLVAEAAIVFGVAASR